MEFENEFSLESPHGEILSIVGCTDDDCDCTMIELAKRKKGKTRRAQITLPRLALELLQESIEAILEFHDSKYCD